MKHDAQKHLGATCCRGSAEFAHDCLQGTKTLQENEQLKAHVAELQKENGQLGNNLETMTAARDELTKENEALKAEIKARKTKQSGTKATSRKRHRR